MSDFKKAVEKVLGEYKDTDTRKKYSEPVSSYKIVFESPQAQLEPLYYWILDFVRDAGWKNVEKLVDNFAASPGSGQFSDMSQRIIQMQEQISNRLGQGINQVIKSVLSLIYDLKEFEIRLEHYEDYKNKDEETKRRGLLSLKQIFLDNVDMKKGNGSINVLAGQPGFVTLRDLFYLVNTEEELKNQVKEGVVNDQVLRVLTPRLAEFWKWVKYSNEELEKRMSIEKNYLKSQVETLKMYSQWLGPYVKAANDLRQKGFDKDAALVNAFSTSLFELQLYADKEEDAPKYKKYEQKRTYHPIIMIGLKFRGHLGQRAADTRGNYAYQFGGRVEITFDSYALNEQEIELVKKEMEKEGIEDVLMNYNFDIAKEALETLEEDIRHFLKTPEERKKEEEKKKKENIEDPITAIIELIKIILHPIQAIKKGWKNLFTGTKKEEEKIEKVEDIQKDNYIEKEIRAAAAKKASEGLYTMYDIYKKTHEMASSPEDFENENKNLTKEPEPKIKDALHWK